MQAYNMILSCRFFGSFCLTDASKTGPSERLGKPAEGNIVAEIRDFVNGLTPWPAKCEEWPI